MTNTISPRAPVLTRPADESDVTGDVVTLGRLLGIWARPDPDETYLSGGLFVTTIVG